MRSLLQATVPRLAWCLLEASLETLLPTACRGLGDALRDAGAASSSGRQLHAAQQPWAVSSLRAHYAGSAGGADSSSGQPPAGRLPLGLEQVAAMVAAAGRARPPAGHTDFEQRQLLMLFTCTKCDTRAAKAFSKQSYESGVVIVECPGCDNRHLIADHLGWFGQKGECWDGWMPGLGGVGGIAGQILHGGSGSEAETVAEGPGTGRPGRDAALVVIHW